jgi:hypothetical protein
MKILSSDHIEGRITMDGPGRPTLYQEEFAEQAYKLCLAGATNDDLAIAFDVGPRTIDRWLQAHPTFADAIRRGRKIADGEVAHKLYCRAMGYTYETSKVLLSHGVPVSVPQTIHCPPDIRACIFWLRNRQPQRWAVQPRPEQDSGLNLLELEEASERARSAAAA